MSILIQTVCTVFSCGLRDRLVAWFALQTCKWGRVCESFSCGFFLHPFLMNKLEKYLGWDFSGLATSDSIFLNCGLCIHVLLKQSGGVVPCASLEGGTLLVKITDLWEESTTENAEANTVSGRSLWLWFVTPFGFYQWLGAEKCLVSCGVTLRRFLSSWQLHLSI